MWSLSGTGMRPPFFFVLAKKNAPRPVEEKAAWCPNPAWRQVWAKTGVLAGERRMFADWSPGWARAPCLWKLQVVSPRRNAGTHPGCESNWLCFSFTVSACGPRSIYSGAKSLATLGCAEYSAAAPSVTSVPLVPPSAGSCGNGAAAGKEADTNSIRTHGAFPRIVAG